MADYKDYVVSSREILYLSSGDTASNTTVESGGRLNIHSGGIIYDTTTSGVVSVSSGGFASHTVIVSGGRMNCYGEDSGTIAYDAKSVHNVQGISDSSVIFSGASQVINGTATNTIISGGIQKVNYGGLASGTILESGASQIITQSGSASDTIINRSATQEVKTGGVIANSVIYGSCTIDTGGMGVGLALKAGGSLECVNMSINVYEQNLTVDGGYLATTNLTAKNINGAVSLAAYATNLSDCNLSIGSTLKIMNNSVVSSCTFDMSYVGSKMSAIIYDSNLTDCTIKGGKTQVRSSSTLNNVTIAGGIISSGDTLTGTDGRLTVESGGKATNTTVLDDGILVALHGTLVSGVTVQSGGMAYVQSGLMASGNAYMEDVDVYSGGRAFAWLGGVIRNTDVYDGGLIRADDGGIVENANVYSGGVAHVSSGGRMDNLKVYSGGSLWVYGGQFTNLVMEKDTGFGYGFNTVISGTSDGKAIEVDSNICYNMKFNHGNVSSGQIASKVEYLSGCCVYSGGLMRDAVVSGGEQTVYGTVENTLIHSSAELTVMSGGVATNAVINSGGSMMVMSGGKVTNFTAESLDQLSYYAGACLSGTVGGSSYECTGDTYYNLLISSAIVASGQIMSKCDVQSELTVESGGKVYDTKMTWSPFTLTLNNGSEAYDIILYGDMNAYGYARNVTIIGSLWYDDAKHHIIHSGGLFEDVFLQRNAKLTVSSGGTLNRVEVNSGSDLLVYDGGTVTGVKVESGGLLRHAFDTNISGTIAGEEYIADAKHSINWFDSLDVYDGYVAEKWGSAWDDRLSHKKALNVYSGGILKNSEITSYSQVTIHSGGVASNIIINGSTLTVKSGGYVENLTVRGQYIYGEAGGVIKNIDLIRSTSQFYSLPVTITGNVLIGGYNKDYDLRGLNFDENAIVIIDLANDHLYNRFSQSQICYDVNPYLQTYTRLFISPTTPASFAINIQSDAGSKIYSTMEYKSIIEVDNLSVYTDMGKVADLTYVTPTETSDYVYVYGFRDDLAAAHYWNNDLYQSRLVADTVILMLAIKKESFDTITIDNDYATRYNNFCIGQSIENMIINYSGNRKSVYLNRGAKINKLDILEGSVTVNGATIQELNLGTAGLLTLSGDISEVKSINFSDSAELNAIAFTDAYGSLENLTIAAGRILHISLNGVCNLSNLSVYGELALSMDPSTDKASTVNNVKYYNNSTFVAGANSDCVTIDYGSDGIWATYNRIDNWKLSKQNSSLMSSTYSNLEISAEAQIYYSRNWTIDNLWVDSGALVSGNLFDNTRNRKLTGGKIASGGSFYGLTAGDKDQYAYLDLDWQAGEVSGSGGITSGYNIYAQDVESVYIMGRVDEIHLFNTRENMTVGLIANGATLSNVSVHNTGFKADSGSVISNVVLQNASGNVAANGCLENTVVNGGVLTMNDGSSLKGRTILNGQMILSGNVVNSGTLELGVSHLAAQAAMIENYQNLTNADFVVNADNVLTGQYLLTSGGAVLNSLTIKIDGQTFALENGKAQLIGNETYLFTANAEKQTMQLDISAKYKAVYGRADHNDSELYIVNCTITGGAFNSRTDIKGSAYSVIDLTGTNNANIYGGGNNINVGNAIKMQVSGGGIYQGMIFGGVRAEAKNCTVGGDSELNINGAITHKDNVKLLNQGTSAWIVGGGGALNGGTITAGKIHISVGGEATLGRLVGGAQANGANASATVTDTKISLANCTVTGDIFGGGYAYDHGKSVVNGNTLIELNTGNSALTIMGNVYGGGANPLAGKFGGESLVLGSTTIALTGNGDLLTIGGTISGDGKMPGSVAGTKILAFNGFSGDFNVSVCNFDVVRFTGNTEVTSGNGYLCNTFEFDLTNRAADLSEVAFMQNSDAFGFADGEQLVKIEIGELDLRTKFSLMQLADDSVAESLKFELYQNQVLLGSFEFGETLNNYTASVDNGKLVIGRITA